ncbi:Beta-lactamase superfamily domain [Fragilaria crotonensis]|nr:Beta-lactamase superfamily domain [Fragilaria crotonensis]
MTSAVRILTTASVDSTPSLLLVAPNGDKILVNCGEGCQRAFLEASGLKLKTVKRICLTRLHPTVLGGLPGLLLTLADASENATLAVAAMQQEKANRSNNKQPQNNGTTDKTTNASNEVSSGTDGRKQQQMPSNESKHRTEEVTGGIELHGPVGTQAFVHSLRHFMRRDRFEFVVREGEHDQPHAIIHEPKRKKMKKSNSDSDAFVDYTIRALAFQHALDDQVSVPIQSFIFQTPPLVGRFRPDRAAELGIPKGPLYSQLKNGNCVTFAKDGKEITVQPHQVLEAGHPGLAIVVVYCPTKHVLRQLQENKRLQSFQNIQNMETQLDLMVHMTPRDLTIDIEYQSWVQSFPTCTTHIWMDANETLNGNQNTESTPFVAASLGAGIKDDAVSELWKEKVEAAKLFVKLSGASEVADKSMVLPTLRNESGCGEILFTGTGSALPCKHRNVTGICVTLERHQRILLDCGEGTVGQLLRSDNQKAFRDSLLESIQAVWISHPHADHHLGILRLLSERKTGEPLILIAPPNLFDFLVEYEAIDPTVCGSYRWLNCYDLVAPATPDPVLSQQLELRLGITSLLAVPVSHCRHAFALVLDSPKELLGRIAYSGDCRPSTKFADLGQHADILIHEATFEDGMEEEALLKKHCTRYPKMPLLIKSDAANEESQLVTPVVFCFDFMKLTPVSIPQAAKLTDAMRLLYPEEVDKKCNDDDQEVDAKTIMSIPGLFARSELL